MASLAAFLSVRDLISGASDVFLLSNSILRPPITLHNSVFCRLEILEGGLSLEDFWRMEDYSDDLERLAAAGLCGGRRSSAVRSNFVIFF